MAALQVANRPVFKEGSQGCQHIADSGTAPLYPLLRSAAVEALKASAGGASGSGNGPAAAEAGTAEPSTPSVAALVQRLEDLALGQVGGGGEAV